VSKCWHWFCLTGYVDCVCRCIDGLFLQECLSSVPTVLGDRVILMGEDKLIKCT
jgi:hypothetical protein